MPLIAIKMDGAPALLRKLGNLPLNVQKGALRRGVNKALTPILKTAKAAARRRTGALKRSLKRKVKTYASGTVVGLVGPDKNTVGEYQGKIIRPHKYAHLVEKNYPFLRPAADGTREQQSKIMADEIRVELRKAKA